MIFNGKVGMHGGGSKTEARGPLPDIENTSATFRCVNRLLSRNFICITLGLKRDSGWIEGKSRKYGEQGMDKRRN